MSMLAKIAGASMSGGGSNIRDGKYNVLVESITLDKKHTGEVFIAELRVMEATPNGEAQINPDGKTTSGSPVVPNPVNSTMSMVCNLTKHESAAGNAKKFIYNVLRGLKPDLAEDAITEQMLLDAVGANQPLRGFAVTCETYRTVNKGRANAANAGNILVLQKWAPIQQDREAIKRQRDWLAGNKSAVDTAAPAAPTPTTNTPPTGGPTGTGGGGLMGLI